MNTAARLDPIEALRAEGVEFRTNANVGVNVDINELKRDFDAVLLAGGSTVPRDLPLQCRDVDHAGVGHSARRYR